MKQTAAVPAPASSVQTAGTLVCMLEVAALREHPSNPRKAFSPEQLADLVASVKELGVLNPILVRPFGHDGFEILAGHRRFRAAKNAGLAAIPAMVRELDDRAALEVMLVDNLQRSDLHPLEEADGYRQLMAVGKYDVARIAERVGRSVKYVYDRVKLLSLSKELQQIFRDGEITAGHAVILARLSTADQKRIIEDPRNGLFNSEVTASLFTPEEQHQLDEKSQRAYDSGAGMSKWERKACSVRELQSWVNAHSRLEADQIDPMLFPETVDALKTATEAEEKVIRITYERTTPEELKNQPGKVILSSSWRRADGQRNSKKCDLSRLGYVVIGPGRGQAFEVCVDKKRCEVHWGSEIKAAKVRERAASKGDTGETREAISRDHAEAERRAEQFEMERWGRAEKVLMGAFKDAVLKADATAKGPLAGFLDLDPRAALGPGKTAEDLVRHLAFRGATDHYNFHSYDRKEWIKDGKALGVDVVKLVDQVSPKALASVAAPKKAKAKKA